MRFGERGEPSRQSARLVAAVVEFVVRGNGRKATMRTALIILAAGTLLHTGCSEKSSTPQHTLRITDIRTGKVMVVKRDDYFKIAGAGNPPRVTVLPLSPEVTGAVLSQYDSFVAKAMADRDRNPNASFLLMSLHESMSRGDLEGVAQRILYYEFFGEALP
jgi:hypothetical protein